MTATLCSFDSTDALISARLRAPDYREWRAQVEATGGCAEPVRLAGHSEIRDRDGAVLVERWGEILAPCGNRRASVCPACSDRYAGDAFHLLRAGLAGGAKDVPTTVTDKPRAFLTLTAPSFGPVHTRRTTPAGRAIPCGCGERHHPDDPRIGSPLDPDTYDYVGAVLWQAHAGRSGTGSPSPCAAPWPGTSASRSAPSRTQRGCPTPRSPSTSGAGSCTSTPSFGSTARTVPPTQRQPPSPPTSCARPSPPRPPPSHSPSSAPTGHRSCCGGAPSSTCATSPAARAIEVEDGDGQISEARLAGYIAKYATKGTGATEGADRPIRDGAHIAYLDVTPHHRRIIDTVWQLGGLAQYEELEPAPLGAHARLPRPLPDQEPPLLHHLRRHPRRTPHLAPARHPRPARPRDRRPGRRPARPRHRHRDQRLAAVGIGHHNHAERELAMAIAERHRTRRTTRREHR